MFLYPAACDLDEDLLELVTMAIVACDGDRACRLRPYDRARCALVYLRKHETFEQLAAGFGIGVATAWRYTNDTIECLAAFAPSLTEALTSHHADGYVLLDGTVAETDRVQEPGHFSGKIHREGVNLQVITAEEGKLLWLSPALPGGTHDVKAAREHGIVDACAHLDLEVLADKGYQAPAAPSSLPSSADRTPDCPTNTRSRTRSMPHCGLPSSGPGPLQSPISLRFPLVKR